MNMFSQKNEHGHDMNVDIVLGHGRGQEQQQRQGHGQGKGQARTWTRKDRDRERDTNMDPLISELSFSSGQHIFHFQATTTVCRSIEPLQKIYWKKKLGVCTLQCSTCIHFASPFSFLFNFIFLFLSNNPPFSLPPFKF
jgi:hypothetical protein